MPKSPSIWFSKFGDKKAGTSQSHDVGRYESRLINQDHTNHTTTSRKPSKHDRARRDTDAEADKQARTKSRSQAKSQGCDVWCYDSD